MNATTELERVEAALTHTPQTAPQIAKAARACPDRIYQHLNWLLAHKRVIYTQQPVSNPNRPRLFWSLPDPNAVAPEPAPQIEPELSQVEPEPSQSLSDAVPQVEPEPNPEPQVVQPAPSQSLSNLQPAPAPPSMPRRLPVLRSCALSFLRRLDRSGLLIPAPRTVEVIAKHHDLSLAVVQTYCTTLTAHGFLRREGPPRSSVYFHPVYFRTDKPAPEPRSHKRDPDAEEPCELPQSYRAVAQALPLEPESVDVRGLIARLAQAKLRCDQSTVNAALHTLDRHGFARCVGQVSSKRADGVQRPGPPRKLWARTDKPLPDPDAHNKQVAAAVRQLLQTQGPMLPREVAQVLGRPHDKITERVGNAPDILTLCEDRADPVKPGDSTPRGKWFVLCLRGQEDDARALLSKRRSEAFGRSSRADKPAAPPKPDKPKTPPKSKVNPCPDRPKTQEPRTPSPNTSRPKPAPSSTSTSPTTSRASAPTPPAFKSPSSPPPTTPRQAPAPSPKPAPLTTSTKPAPLTTSTTTAPPKPRPIVSDDMSDAERIERIRVAIAQAVPRLRARGVVKDLYFIEGQLLHRHPLRLRLPATQGAAHDHAV